MIDPYALPQVKIPEGMIHLGIGQPTNDLLPKEQIASAWQEALATDDTFYMTYGEDRGNKNLRRSLARFLSTDFPAPVDPDTLMITNGNSHALDFICARFTSPGDTIFTEDPSYFLALRIFADHQLNVVGLPMDDAGIVINGLSELIEQHQPKLVYTIPTHHNPAAVSLSESRRKALVNICRDHDVLIVADEVYHFLTFEEQRPMPMGAFSDQGPVISLGSFSKILAPGLRLGWIQAGQAVIEKLEQAGVIVSGGGFNPFTSQMVEAFIRSGRLEKNIAHLNQTYSRRLALMSQALEDCFGGSVKFFKPEGGYFLWLELPGSFDAKSLRNKALKNGVDFYAGSLFSPSGTHKNYLRLAFSFYRERELKEGILRLFRTFNS